MELDRKNQNLPITCYVLPLAESTFYSTLVRLISRTHSDIDAYKHTYTLYSSWPAQLCRSVGIEAVRAMEGPTPKQSIVQKRKAEFYAKARAEKAQEVIMKARAKSSSETDRRVAGLSEDMQAGGMDPKDAESEARRLIEAEQERYLVAPKTPPEPISISSDSSSSSSSDSSSSSSSSSPEPKRKRKRWQVGIITPKAQEPEREGCNNNMTRQTDTTTMNEDDR